MNYYNTGLARYSQWSNRVTGDMSLANLILNGFEDTTDKMNPILRTCFGTWVRGHSGNATA